MLSRIVRDTAIVCFVLTIISLVVWPRQWEIPLGVMGGGAMLGVSFWVIRGTVDGLVGRVQGGDVMGARVRSSMVWGLVKFFTRYAMLAFAAYVMMARLHLDPVGMLAGVSALGVAAGVEALRGKRPPSVGERG